MADKNGDSWRSRDFRNKIVSQIEEAIRQSGSAIPKTSAEMENHVFHKAKSKDEYMSYVARLILHVRELNVTTRPTAQGMAPSNSGSMSSSGIIGSSMGLQDPIVALQSLARQGNTAQSGSVMSNVHGALPPVPTQIPQLSTTLPGQPPPPPPPPPLPPPQPQAQQGTGMAPGMVVQPIGGVQVSMGQTQAISSGTGHPTFGGNMVGSGKSRLPDLIASSNSRQMPMPKMSAKQLAAAQKAIQLSQSMQPPNKAIPQLQSGSVLGDGLIISRDGPPQAMGNTQFVSQGASTAPIPRQSTPSAFAVQSPNLPQVTIHNPLTPGSGGQMLSSAQPTTSPASYISGFSPLVIPSPTLASACRTPSGTSVLSPGSALNTPASSVSAPSPVGRSIDDQVYLEKVKQLSKYIEPLRRMIARADKDEDKKKNELSKMKNLLDILSNPSKRLPLDTLRKCEQVLEKLDLKVKPAELAVGSTPSIPIPHLSNDQGMFQPLLEAIVVHLKSPTLNHTLQRTFGPAVAALHGPFLRSPSPPLKRKKIDEDVSDVPDVLQGEIARLDQRFKVNLDPIQHSGSRTVHLICQLDDKNLPCVPPIKVTVPDSYPQKPPQCDTSSDEYDSTPFLQAVHKALVARITKMPDSYSMTTLLDTWEMSVRQACAIACTVVTSTTE